MQEMESARAHQQLLERSPDTEATPRVTLQQFRNAQRATPRAFYEQLLQDCSTCADTVTKLANAADVRLGLEGPSFSPLKSALESYSETVQRIARENGVIGPSRENETSEPVAAEFDAATPTLEQRDTDAVVGPIRSRAQALQQLRQVADFFRRTEPHSPVAYLADKAAGWGEMPLHVWLRTVLKDEGSIARFEDLLGFEAPDDAT
jgi:type VI secretion system protein ImpA